MSIRDHDYDQGRPRVSDREAAIRELRQRLADWSPDAPEEAQKGYKAAAWDAFVIVEAELAAARQHLRTTQVALKATREREAKLRLELDETGECVRLCTPEAQAEVTKMREALRALPHQKWCSAAQSAGMVPCNCPRALADGEGET